MKMYLSIQCERCGAYNRTVVMVPKTTKREDIASVLGYAGHHTLHQVMTAGWDDVPINRKIDGEAVDADETVCDRCIADPERVRVYGPWPMGSEW